MILAMELTDEHPVLLANGPKGLLHHVEAVVDGSAAAPRAIVVGERELAALRQSGLMAVLATVPVLVIQVAAPCPPVSREGATWERTCVEGVRELLAA